MAEKGGRPAVWHVSRMSASQGAVGFLTRQHLVLALCDRRTDSPPWCAPPPAAASPRLALPQRAAHCRPQPAASPCPAAEELQNVEGTSIGTLRQPWSWAYLASSTRAGCRGALAPPAEGHRVSFLQHVPKITWRTAGIHVETWITSHHSRDPPSRPRHGASPRPGLGGCQSNRPGCGFPSQVDWPQTT